MSDNSIIPLVDLKAQYLSLKGDIDKTIADCINDGAFIKGKRVVDFESDFAGYIGAEYCVSCGNGTDALELILASLGVRSGDEVIVPALSWIATAEAVNNVGAEPVFVDIKKDNFTIDADSIEVKITARTKAIIVVHLYGSPADMNEISAVSTKYGLHLIEDCAQAHGAEYENRKIGTFGIASAFSFFPSKNLGAFGDGGAIITNDLKLAENARMIANHGQLNVRHTHSVIGRNSRLDTIQAAILSVKLPYLDKWNNKRVEISELYRNLLSTAGEIEFPVIESYKKHVYHLFVIRSRHRDQIQKILEENNIITGIHYPKPLPFIDAYSYKGHAQSDFPVSLNACSEILSLPIYPELSDLQVCRICDHILKIL